MAEFKSRHSEGKDAAERREDGESYYEERVLSIRRTAAVMKGGRRFSFSALVVVGDRQGHVGFGYSKAKEVPQAVEKSVKIAKKNLLLAPFWGKTIPHEVEAKYRSSRVLLRPAVEGTGIVAGQAVRAVVSLAGYQNILAKVFGNTNPINLVKATFEAIRALRSRRDIERLRGVRLSAAGGSA